MIFKKSRTMSDIQSQIKANYIVSNGLREKMRVLIIDDNEVPYQNALNRLSFNISHKLDIEDIRDVEPYHVIICDIKGVGLNFSRDKEGSAIILNIKKMYPEKGVIVYSGGTFDVSLTNIFSQADDTITKGTDAIDIASKLDATFDKILDPNRLWKDISQKLLSAGIADKKLKDLEREYLESISTFDSGGFIEKLSKFGSSINIQDIVKSVSALINLYIALK